MLILERRHSPVYPEYTTEHTTATATDITDIGYYEREAKSSEMTLPKQKKRVRRKVRCEAEWKRNVRKRLKNIGKSYTSSSGKVVREKKMGDGCSDKCCYRCKEHISQEIRQSIFKTYWQTGDINIPCQTVSL